MVPLSALWLPILLSAAFVFIASNILWMALPFWHHRDYKKLPDEPAAIAALSSATSGMYIAPSVDWGKISAEEKEPILRGPMAMILLRNPAKFAMGKALALYFLYPLVISTFIGYLTGVVLAPGVAYMVVFRVAGTAGILAYCFGGIPYTIWYGKPWAATLRDIIDGVIHGLLTAGTFGWLWPK